ncbi:hypothetical protein UPYG_G00090620 [Umbra pygmaea]|uniref:DUF4211 domain-containing protein n=1 Tax=Umbra pygmaea TaxID=75934 RepID=A0ABD0XX40_UMBPY
MMDRNYPNSSFADPLAQPAQTVAWAYERSPANIKPSYVAAHLESELLHRQTYVSAQLPTYTSTHHPPSLSGVFDPGSSTTESSVMNFLSAMESRALQAGPALLPPFRNPPWQTGSNHTTELFLTGALPSAATFPSPAALSTYQHTGAFPSLSYATTPSLALHDSAFSSSNNGLLSPHHDPLLQLKPIQATLPTSLAFDRLPPPSLGAALPPQSSTYRSAQESAPHLLQPQFGLLPLATQPTPQPYGVPVFSGSIERALQRECSVIKHHQRPSSSSHAVPDTLPGSQHSLQAYLGSGSEDGDVSFQPDTSRHTPVPCSPSTGSDSSHGVNGAPQAETGLQPQTYSSSVIPPPSGYPSSFVGAKTKDCSSKLTPGVQDGHRHSQDSPEGYPSPVQKQGSVIASQPYTSAQLPSLMSTLSHSQGYVSTQAYLSPSTDKLPSLYKTLPSLSDHSGNVASVSQSLVYTSSLGQGQGNEGQYGAQGQGLCLGNPSQSYHSSHSRGAPIVSYSSQSQGQVSVCQSQSYTTGQSLSTSYTSPPTPISSQGYTSFSSAPHTQALQNCRPSVQELKPTYSKLKLEGEIPLQDLQQVSLETTGPRGSVDPAAHSNNNLVYVVSKMDDRYNTQSVIRSNSRTEDQTVGLKTSVNVQPMSVHGAISDEALKQHSLLLKGSESLHENNQTQSAHNHTQYIRVPNSQVLLEPNREMQMILLQKPLIYPGHNPSKLQQIPGSSQIPAQYLPMEGDHLISQSQHGTLGQNTLTDSTKQRLSSSKHPYSQSNSQQQSHDAKHHFALSSICFPESILLADERNILSNVDDILAATAAACGVMPQDFVKATSGTSESDMADAKGHFQTGDTRHQSPSFSSSSSQQSITNTNSHNTMALTLNGTHITSDEHQFSKGDGRLGQLYTMSHSQTAIINSSQDICANKSFLQKSEDELNRISPKGQSVHPSSRADDNANGGPSENDYHLSGHGFDPLGHLNSGHAKHQIHKGIGREDSLVEFPSNPKKRVRSKASAKPPSPEEENGQPRKKTVQAKRQNSRGSDPTSSPSTSEVVYDSYQQQERMRQKIREVEEQQPEVKTGFIGSFLDFLKTGPKQQFSSPPIRTASRTRKPSTSSKRPPCPLPPLTPTIQSPSGALITHEAHGIAAGGSSHMQQKCLDDEFQKNLETLPSFSSDEDESSTRKNQALQNSISSALSALDEPSDRTQADNQISCSLLKPDQGPSMPHSIAEAPEQQMAAPMESAATGSSFSASECLGQEGRKSAASGQLAFQLSSVAIEGLTDEELSDSGGEGMYRERDEFVVKNEDMEILKLTLTAGQEPPAIWKVQKALLQKFVPELRDDKRVFSATNSYLGYFGDAKTMYGRVYVKFLDTVNKREYVRVCNRKPRCKPMHSLRGSQAKTILSLKASPSSVTSDPAATPTSQKSEFKPRPRQPKTKAEPPPKKRRRWKEEYSPPPSESSEEVEPENDEFPPPVPLACRFLNTRTMKETFRSFVELLVSVALDADVMSTLERENDELLLPHMRKVEVMISDNRRRLLPRLHLGQLFKTALDSFPEISVVTELKKDGETPAFKVQLSGRAYNRKNMKPSKAPCQLPLEYTVDQQNTQWFSLYHSLQHYKYHTFLMCKDEIASLRVQAGDMAHEHTVQLCMRNTTWVEVLFDRFGELINQVQQACL